MRTTKRLLQGTALVAGVVGTLAAIAPDSAAGRLARRLTRDVRYAVASAPGILYRLAGRKPDPDVADDVLADRIRSMLGPLEHRLDVPRVHVMVDHHVAILHGEIADERSACRIENAVLDISGVSGVESHLHVGLERGDTRPSEGRKHQPPSPAMQTLLDAAKAGGAHEPRAAVHAVLCGFSDRIPAEELAQVFAHLPADVRTVAGPPRRVGEHLTRLKTVPQLVAAVTAQGGIEPARAEEITRAVLAALRGVIPEEARDVAAVLPAELRELWETEPAR